MIFVREDRVEGPQPNQTNNSNSKGYVSLQPSFRNNTNTGRTVSIGNYYQ
jgi:hypothetical protein